MTTRRDPDDEPTDVRPADGKRTLIGQAVASADAPSPVEPASTPAPAPPAPEPSPSWMGPRHSAFGGSAPGGWMNRGR